MPVAIITGSGGLIGSEAVGHFVGEGYDVVGIENDMRASFFGPEASTAHVTERLLAAHPEFRSESVDIRDREAVDRIFSERGKEIELVIHTAAQPSHDWAASDPQTDFGVNANGTLNLLEATRANCPEAPFIFCSTNKVYGDTPNRLPLEDARDAPRAAGVPPLSPRDRHDDVDRLLDPLAVRRLEGGRRPPGPGVRPLLRDADGLLPRRLPDRPPARRRQAPRLPRLPDEVHRDRDPVHRLRLRGQAGARQHPQRRPDRGLRRVPRRPPRRRRLQHRRRPLQQLLDARGDRDLRAGRRPRAELGDGGGAADRRPPLVDLRPGAVRSRLPRAGSSATASRTSSPRCTSRTPSAGRWPRREALGRDPGPERGGLGREDRRRRRLGARAREDLLRGPGHRRRQRGRHRGRRRGDRRRQPARSGSGPPTTKRASGWRSGPASTCSRATRS